MTYIFHFILTFHFPNWSRWEKYRVSSQKRYCTKCGLEQRRLVT